MKPKRYEEIAEKEFKEFNKEKRKRQKKEVEK